MSPVWYTLVYNAGFIQKHFCINKVLDCIYQYNADSTWLWRDQVSYLNHVVWYFESVCASGYY